MWRSSGPCDIGRAWRHDLATLHHEVWINALTAKVYEAVATEAGFGSWWDVTLVDFRHSGWDERSEYFGFCNFSWGEALGKLKQRCESES